MRSLGLGAVEIAGAIVAILAAVGAAYAWLRGKILRDATAGAKERAHAIEQKNDARESQLASAERAEAAAIVERTEKQSEVRETSDDDADRLLSDARARWTDAKR